MVYHKLNQISTEYYRTFHKKVPFFTHMYIHLHKLAFKVARMYPKLRIKKKLRHFDFFGKCNRQREELSTKYINTYHVLYIFGNTNLNAEANNAYALFATVQVFGSYIVKKRCFCFYYSFSIMFALCLPCLDNYPNVFKSFDSMT